MSADKRLNPDRPIQSWTEDKLGRTRFAQKLADTISNWQGQESLVIGLFGGWGAGKSSVKNLILEHLQTFGNLGPTVVEFNPWLVSGEEKITQAFFGEVGNKLEKEDSNATESRADSWRKYARLFGFSSQLARTFDLISPLFVEGLPKFGGLAAEYLKQGEELAVSAADSLEQRSISLDEVKQTLRKNFQNLNRPILVVIDDIDRLTTEEICLVFRLVKANADFPNFVYLLLFQRETAEHALNKISDDRGAEFLEKIVQVGFDLPAPSQKSLHQLLFNEIDRVLGTVAQENGMEPERWTNTWLTGLSRYFTNVREIYRFLNSFAFMVSAFEQDGILEVNPVDLISIECLRIFEPRVYSIVRDNKAVLTEHPRSRSVGQDQRQTLFSEIQDASRYDSERLKQLLELLFPGYHYSADAELTWTREKRICSPDFFDRYFALQLSQDQVSESIIQHILSAAEDGMALRRIFQDLEKSNRLVPAFERLAAEDSLDKLENPLPYLLILADHSDNLSQTTISGFPWPGRILVQNAVNRVLNRQSNGDARRQLLFSLIRESKCICLAAEWINEVSSDDEKIGFPRIDEIQISQLKDRWLERVRSAAKEERLLRLTDMAHVFSLWMKWGTPNEVKNWVGSFLEDPKQILCFLKLHVRRTSSQSLGNRLSRDEDWLPWKSLEPFQALDVWKQVAEKLMQQQNLTEDEKQMLKFFRAAVDRWESGVSDEDRRSYLGQKQRNRVALLKQDLQQHKAAVELTHIVQKELISHHLSPFLKQLIQNIAEFDEMYASSILSIIGNYSVVGAPGGNAAWNESFPGTDKITAPNKLEASLTEGKLFSTLQIMYSWQGFTRAEANPFADSFSLEIRFERLHYEVKLHDGGKQPFEYQNVYGKWLSDEEAAALIRLCTEARLENITTQKQRR